MKDSADVKYKNCSYWFDKITSNGGQIFVYEGEDAFKTPHQKWIMNNPFETEYDEASKKSGCKLSMAVQI